jgi:hypothetical protein
MLNRSKLQSKDSVGNVGPAMGARNHASRLRVVVPARQPMQLGYSVPDSVLRFLAPYIAGLKFSTLVKNYYWNAILALKC